MCIPMRTHGYIVQITVKLLSILYGKGNKPFSHIKPSCVAGTN